VEFRFKRVITLGEYERDLRYLILRMKTDKTGMLAISAAKALARYRRTDLESVQADYVIPIPMHHLRRWDRGVNAPDLLAEELARQLKIPVVRHLVQRIRQTDLQYTLSPQTRAQNVGDAFALRQPFRLLSLLPLSLLPSAARCLSSDLSGKNVLLIDDILTTGSTCNEVAKVLLAARVRSVTVAVLARAEGSYRR
jgi:predicted amidophosphoribosyltransferase